MSLFHFSKKKVIEEDIAQSEVEKELEELKEEKQDMIRGVEDLSTTTVKEVMVPRIDVDFISIDTPLDELLEKLSESGHSRFPIYSESVDNVIGILYVKDLIYSLAKKEEYSLEKIIRKTYFVPESKRIDSLLREFKRRHLHIAMAIDEYGGISGIVTMEDIIEEIVGDIQDEFDNEKEDIIVLGTNTWLCDARVNLEDLNESLKTDFPATDFDSLGGFAFDIFGKIPAKFEKATYKNYDFIIQDMEGHRINVIKIIKKEETVDGDVEE